jgi:hypothetical protein
VRETAAEGKKEIVLHMKKRKKDEKLPISLYTIDIKYKGRE